MEHAILSHSLVFLFHTEDLSWTALPVLDSTPSLASHSYTSVYVDYALCNNSVAVIVVLWPCSVSFLEREPGCSRDTVKQETDEQEDKDRKRHKERERDMWSTHRIRGASSSGASDSFRVAGGAAAILGLSS